MRVDHIYIICQLTLFGMNKSRGPYEDEWDQRQCSSSFTSTSNSNSTDRSFKDELEFTEQDGGYGSHRVRQDSSVESVLEVSNDT